MNTYICVFFLLLGHKANHFHLVFPNFSLFLFFDFWKKGHKFQKRGVDRTELPPSPYPTAMSRQIKCKTFVIFRSFQRALYSTPSLFKCSRFSQNTSSIFVSEIMIVFKHLFSKRFSIRFCILKSNSFFSLHWASQLRMAQSQNRGYDESEKMTLKLE